MQPKLAAAAYLPSSLFLCTHSCSPPVAGTVINKSFPNPAFTNAFTYVEAILALAESIYY